MAKQTQLPVKCQAHCAVFTVPSENCDNHGNVLLSSGCSSVGLWSNLARVQTFESTLWADSSGPVILNSFFPVEIKMTNERRRGD